MTIRFDVYMGFGPDFRNRPPVVTFSGYPPLEDESFRSYQARVQPLIMKEVLK